MSAEFIARQAFRTDYRSPLRFIISHVLRHPWVALAMVFGAFSNAALAVAVPNFVGGAFNALNAGEGLVAVGQFALAIVASQLLRAGLQLVRNFSAEIFAQRIERDVRDELYASLLGKSMTFHDMQPVGEIMARVTNDVRELNLMMNPGANLLVGSSMFLITPFIAVPLLHPALILGPTLFVIGYIIVQARYLRKLMPSAQGVRRSFGQMNADVAEVLDGLQVVKGTAQEKREAEKFNTLADRLRDAVVRQGNLEAQYFPLLLWGLLFCVGYAQAAHLYNAGLIDIGAVVALMGQIGLLGFPVFTSQFSFAQISLGYASAARILSIITTETDLDQNSAGHEATISGSITFENVTFGYASVSDDAANTGAVLHNLSFSVPAGKTIAIVGQTGSGKSTLTKLINRTYDADSGRVLVDGVDVRDWNLARLRSQISVIEQDIFLFSRSIADNIRFGKPEATQAEIEEAARKAQAHDFILSFSEGYETMVGQRGVTLSGGQRQRIALARAFVTNPPILVLDDSTSAIDSATEDKIQQAIWSAAQGRTTLLITHRLSQIRWADHIVVLKQGRVVAQGAHEQLLAESEAYRRIFARYDDADLTQVTPAAGLTERK